MTDHQAAASKRGKRLYDLLTEYWVNYALSQ